jgi:glucose-6-phosphate 1-dehydrogenase
LIEQIDDGRGRPVISRLVLFGATGDLAARYLFPALVAMHAAGRLPSPFSIIGVARDPLTDDAFRDRVADALSTHATDAAPESRAAVVAATRYSAVDMADPADVGRVIAVGDDGSPLAAYLALPPTLFPNALRSLAEAGMPEGSRVAIEKPFGTSLDGARSLNALVGELFGKAAERIVFRVDHVLGMATAQNLIGLRVADRALGALWNGEAIEQVEVLWEEVLGLEGRAGYFDEAGALKDVMQNHMLQVLALVAMEPPASPSERDLREAKVRALEAVRSPGTDVMAERTRRARYGAGTLAPTTGTGARPVPAYADEAGVDPARETETLAEVAVYVDTPRWQGTRFVLRGGKALAERRKGILLRFRPPAGGSPPFADGARSTMWIGIDGPNDIRLELVGMSSEAEPASAPVVLSAPPPSASLPAYGNVLADLLGGGSRLSVRGDEAVEAWRIVMPVIEAWAAGVVPLEEYSAGAAGLAPRS